MFYLNYTLDTVLVTVVINGADTKYAVYTV